MCSPPLIFILLHLHFIVFYISFSFLFTNPSFISPFPSFPIISLCIYLSSLLRFFKLSSSIESFCIFFSTFLVFCSFLLTLPSRPPPPSKSFPLSVACSSPLSSSPLLYLFCSCSGAHEIQCDWAAWRRWGGEQKTAASDWMKVGQSGPLM